ncbi:MAG TPA: hypothetical protein VF290_06880 [Pyrinomonadaceae bacterium]
MAPRNPLDAELIVSYLTLRKAVGYLGLLMPILVRVGAYYFEQIPSNTSISAYYYTSMRDLFVGTLAAIGVFLFCYRGTDTQDNVLTNIAGACAVAIGLLPTEPEYHPLIQAKFPNILTDECYRNHGPLGYHIYVVGAFFLIISYLTIFRFTKPGPSDDINRKRWRNKVYIACGIVMVICIALVVIIKLRDYTSSIFWPETVAIVAFAIAWLTKGHAILKDRHEAT